MTRKQTMLVNGYTVRFVNFGDSLVGVCCMWRAEARRQGDGPLCCPHSHLVSRHLWRIRELSCIVFTNQRVPFLAATNFNRRHECIGFHFPAECDVNDRNE